MFPAYWLFLGSLWDKLGNSIITFGTRGKFKKIKTLEQYPTLELEVFLNFTACLTLQIPEYFAAQSGHDVH